MNTRELQLGKSTIAYRILRSSQIDHARIQVSLEDGVVVRIPQKATDADADKAVARKATWIHQRLALIAELPPPPKPYEYVSGETFRYLGRQYRLKILSAEGRTTTVKLLGRYLTVSLAAHVPETKRHERIVHAVERWHKEHARTKITNRVKHFSGRIGVKPAAIRICSQKRRWGSCSRDGTLRFNWQIISAPATLVDYVVVHELCHLKEPNHSAAFWKILGQIMPDFSSRRIRLKFNNFRLCSE